MNRAAPNLAEVALELQLAKSEADFRQMSFALELEARCAGKCRSRLEHVAAQIELSPASTRDALDQWEYRARLLAEAHDLLRALIPHEAQIRRMVSSQDAAAAA